MTILTINTKFYHMQVDANQPASRFAKALHHFKETAKDDNIRTGMIKTIRAAIALFDAVLSSSHQEIRAGLGFAADILRVSTIPTTITNLIQERKDRFKTLVNTMDLANALLSGAKVLDYLKLIDLGKVATSFGKIPVIGAGVAKALPFANIVNIVDVVRSGLAIANTTKEMRKEKLKREKYKAKKVLWQKIQATGSLDSIMAEKIRSNTEKSKNAQLQVNAAKQKMEKRLKKFEKRTAQHEAILKLWEKSTGTERLRLKIKTYRAFSKAKRAQNEYEKAVISYAEGQKNLDKYELRKNDWSQFPAKIKEMNQPREATKKLIELKVEKWDRKILNSNRLKKDSRISIALNVASIILSVASIVFTILAISTLPFLSIPMALAAFALVGASVGVMIWKKVRSDISYKPVPVSLLWEKQGAVQ